MAFVGPTRYCAICLIGGREGLRAPLSARGQGRGVESTPSSRNSRPRSAPLLSSCSRGSWRNNNKTEEQGQQPRGTSHMDYMQFATDNHAWIIMIVNGLIAGWLAGLLLGGGGLIRNLVVGLIGAVVGGWLFNAGSLPVTDYYDFNSIVPPYGHQIAVS